MPRLIDADALLKRICELCGENCEMPNEAVQCIEWEFAHDAIESLPTIDAEPVKHGHWDDMGDFEQCSVCHGTHLKEYQTYYGKCLWIKTDYCPHCGAKMDDKKYD